MLRECERDGFRAKQNQSALALRLGFLRGKGLRKGA